MEGSKAKHLFCYLLAKQLPQPSFFLAFSSVNHNRHRSTFISNALHFYSWVYYYLFSFLIGKFSNKWNNIYFKKYINSSAREVLCTLHCFKCGRFWGPPPIQHHYLIHIITNMLLRCYWHVIHLIFIRFLTYTQAKINMQLKHKEEMPNLTTLMVQTGV